MRFIAKVFLIVCIASTILPVSVFATDYTVLANGDYFGAMFFDPPLITVNQGDRIRWVNVVLVQHTATSGADDCVPSGTFTTGILNPGDTSAYVTFNTVGTIPYFCRFHCFMGMTGEITVKTAPVATQQKTWGAIKALYSASTSR